MRIPIHAENGVVVDEATIDEVDGMVVSACRWRLNRRGHPVTEIRVDERKFSITMGRFVAGVAPGGPYVRHRNGDPLDNRRENLVLSKEWLGRTVAADSTLSELAVRAVGAMRSTATPGNVE